MKRWSLGLLVLVISLTACGPEGQDLDGYTQQTGALLPTLLSNNRLRHTFETRQRVIDCEDMEALVGELQSNQIDIGMVPCTPIVENRRNGLIPWLSRNVRVGQTIVLEGADFRRCHTEIMRVKDIRFGYDIENLVRSIGPFGVKVLASLRSADAVPQNRTIIGVPACDVPQETRFNRTPEVTRTVSIADQGVPDCYYVEQLVRELQSHSIQIKVEACDNNARRYQNSPIKITVGDFTNPTKCHPDLVLPLMIKSSIHHRYKTAVLGPLGFKVVSSGFLNDIPANSAVVAIPYCEK